MDLCELSIVVPCYNEEDNVIPFFLRTRDVLSPLQINYEIIYVDDGSNDSTFSVISNIINENSIIKCIRLSKNFGSHAATMAGISSANGKTVAVLAADLQNPPELLPEMINHWKNGAGIVWALPEIGDKNKNYTSRVFYSLIRSIAIPEYPKQGVDFYLLDRKVVNELKKNADRNIMITGNLFKMGFKQVFIPYKYTDRERGNSKWNISKKIKLAIDMIVSQSYIPIRIMSIFGFTITIISALYALLIMIFTLLGNNQITGWASTIIIVLFLGGVQLTTLGILGEYIWRISDQVKGKPLFIIMEKIGF